jgi:hypothetical protein
MQQRGVVLIERPERFKSLKLTKLLFQLQKPNCCLVNQRKSSKIKCTSANTVVIDETVINAFMKILVSFNYATLED